MTDDKLLYRAQYVFWEMYKTYLSNRRTVIIPMCKIRVGASLQEMHVSVLHGGKQTEKYSLINEETLFW